MSKLENPPQLPTCPAPWNLTGSGYVVALRMPQQVLDCECFVPDSLRPSRRGKIAYLMFVDYTSSDVGPYHELLFIPGSFDFSGKRYLSISKIYVSSEASVVNGQRNWGIPKAVCEFDVQYGADGGIDRVRALLDGQVFADLSFKAFGPRLPIHTAITPAGLHTLGQHWQGQEYIYTPSARGHTRFARLLSASVDARHFPDIARGKPLAAFRITDFRMRFPLSHITPL